MTTVPTSVGSSPARATAALMAMAPRSGAGISFRLPPKVPIAVRNGAMRTTEDGDIMDELSGSERPAGKGRRSINRTAYLHLNGRIYFQVKNQWARRAPIIRASIPGLA